MEEDNSLNITITAVDEASEVIAALGDTVTGLEEQVAPAIQSINEELSTVSESAMGFSQAFFDSVAEIEASMAGLDDVAPEITTIGAAFEETGTLVNTAANEFIDSVNSLNEVLSADTSAITDEVLGMGTSWQEAATQVNAAAAEMEDSAAAAGDATGMMSLKTGAGFIALGTVLTQVGKPLQSFYDSAVTGAANIQTSQQSAITALQGMRQEMIDLKDPTSAVSLQQKTLADQAQNLRSKIDALEAPVSGYKKTIGQLAAAQASHNAQIAVYNDQLALITDKEDRFNNLQKNANVTVEEAAAQFDALARSNEKLGINYSDSMDALVKLNDATGDSTDAEAALNAALDLHLATGMSMAAATTAVAQAYEGNGRSLAQYGIIVKDGASGQEALAAITEATGTAAKNQADTLNVATAGLASTWNGFMSDLGNSQTPLAGLLVSLENIINSLDEWVKAHPKLAEALLIFVGLLGTVLVLMGSIIVLVGTIIIAFALMGVSVAALPILIGVAVLAGIALLIANWSQFKAWFLALWNDIKAFFEDLWKGLGDNVQLFIDLVTGHWSKLGDDLKAVWKDVGSVFASVLNLMIDGINVVINAVNVLIDILRKIPGGKSIFADIPIIPHITAVDDAIISPSGEVITTNPQDYLIATTNPAGLLSGSGAPSGNGNGSQNIIVNIQGDVLTTSQQAIKYGNEMARQINRQLRLTSVK